MRNERKYITLSILSFILVGLLFVSCAREYWRMAAASERQTHEYAMLGAKVYGEYCIQCHGPKGEGVVGLPLNRPDLQGDPRETKFRETYRMILDTIEQGRVGRSIPLWVKTQDGSWLSYTQMPAWGRDHGGPLDEHYVQAAAYFVALGNLPAEPDNPDGSTIWDSIGNQELGLGLPEVKTAGTLPDAKGLSQAENAVVKALIEKQIVPSCLACHTIGGKGGVVGPDLTNVGAWGDRNPEAWEAYLKQWIYDAPSVPDNVRMPTYWYKHRAGRPVPEFKDPIIPTLKTLMPSFKQQFDKLGLEQRDLLVRYLMGLK